MNTFVNKVAAERAVLGVVNSRMPRNRELAGLSWASIESWQGALGYPAADPVVQELKQVSDLCQRLSDRSHETFEPIEPALATAISLHLETLMLLMQSRTRS